MTETPDLLQVILARTETDGDGCQLWLGPVVAPGKDRPNGGGYPLVYDPRDGKTKLGHRLVVELTDGPIPPGLTVDHTCHSESPTCPGGRCKHRRCLTRGHLDPVPQKVNNRRGLSVSAHNDEKTECPARHPYDKANTYVDPTGRRHCRTCRRARTQRWYDERGGADWHREQHQARKQPG
jgi:hypothetical protein